MGKLYTDNIYLIILFINLLTINFVIVKGYIDNKIFFITNPDKIKPQSYFNHLLEHVYLILFIFTVLLGMFILKK